MATVRAFIQKSTKKEEVYLRFKLSYGRHKELCYTSEIKVNPSDWNSEKQTITKGYDKAAFNEKVAARKALIEKIYNEQSDTNVLTSEWLDTAIDKILHSENYKPIEEPPKTLFQYIKAFIATAPQRKDKATGRFLTYNNIQQYKATEKHLKAFAERKKVKDFEFEQIDKVFYNDFVSYLQKEIPVTDNNGKPIYNKDGTPKLIKESFTQNSVGKHVRILKLMLNEATRNGINTSLVYNQFYVFTEDSDAVYLNETELQELKDVDLKETPHLDRVRDWFLLLAWTGCRFSDLEKIGKANIKNGFITFRQQKTNTKVTIPLHPVVLEILEKYNFEMPKPITNQKFNEYIKIVAKIAELTDYEVITKTIGGVLKSETLPKYELISSHTGRRSFCTNMYKRGLPTLMIMSISGHKTEKSFLKYIRVKQEEHAEMIAKKWKEIYK
jgi:integrase